MLKKMTIDFLGNTPSINPVNPESNQKLCPSSNNSSTLIAAVNLAMSSINSLSLPQVPFATLSVDLLGFGNNAAGGYVLYPSKPNNNTAQAVYRK